MSSLNWPKHSIDPGKLTYVSGDATQPQNTIQNELVVIPHITNNLGWGSGFVAALSKRWPKVEKFYVSKVAREKKNKGGVRLGDVQFVKVDEDTYVANMIAQDNAGIFKGTKIPLIYSALIYSMNSVGHGVRAKLQGCQTRPTRLHCPMFGSGIAGGNWEVIEQLIIEIWLNKFRLDVQVYNFDPNFTTNDLTEPDEIDY